MSLVDDVYRGRPCQMQLIDPVVPEQPHLHSRQHGGYQTARGARRFLSSDPLENRTVITRRGRRTSGNSVSGGRQGAVGALTEQIHVSSFKIGCKRLCLLDSISFSLLVKLLLSLNCDEINLLIV